MTRRLIYMRPWIKVARDLPKTRGHYPDGPYSALNVAFCKAAEQPQPGTFESMDVLRALLRQRGKYAKYLLDHGDLVQNGDGSVTLPNWIEFQEYTSTDRMRDKRAQEAAENGDADVTPMCGHSDADVTGMCAQCAENVRSRAPARVETRDERLETRDERGSHEPSAPPSPNGVSPEFQTLQGLAEELTGAAFVLGNPHSALGEKVSRLVAKHGLRAVDREWRRIASEEGGLPEIRQLVLGADNALNPIRAADRPDPKAERAELVARLKAAAP